MRESPRLVQLPPTPEEAFWHEKYHEIETLYREFLDLLDKRYGPLEILRIQNELSEKICPGYKSDSRNRKILQNCMAWCIVVDGSTDFETSPMIDFEAENSIEVYLKEQIEKLKSG